MFRMQNPAQGGPGNDPAMGNDFYQGYLANLSSGGVVLGKQNYDWTTMAIAPGTYNQNTWYHMKVVVSGYNIKVYVTDMVTPVINTNDYNNPFITGRVGIRSHNSRAYFDNFSVKH